MKRKVGLLSRAAVIVMLATGLVLCASGALAGAGEGPTVAEVDSGLLEVSDLLPVFTEVARQAPALQEVARDTGATCDGPNNAARALKIDDSALLAGVAFEAPNREATLNEDAYIFSTAKAAKAFMKATRRQAAGCDTWTSLVIDETAPRSFERLSSKKARLGDQGLRIRTIAGAPGAPLDPATALEREFLYVRTGAVVLSLNFATVADSTITSPGPGYPKSAVKKMDATLS